jgi:actin cytoskeleton-regulatory complex protein SLA1
MCFRPRKQDELADPFLSAAPEPDPSKTRVWTDRSKSFSVEAQFLGVKDGKINLHKVNGVKIAVPVAKMSVKDLEYVELITGISLDEDRPLSDVKRSQTTRNSRPPKPESSKVGASIEPPKSDYDWFQFFLSCDVSVGLCERYAQAFAKDSMDESVLPDVDAGVLRNLGLREGDIIKVMRYLDKRYGHNNKKRNVSFAGDDEGEGSGGGLFSGPGGTLRNNTRKGRPAPAVQASDTVDPKAFSQSKDASSDSPAASSPTTARPKATEKSSGGFDDDAWDVKPSKQPETQAAPAPAPAPEPKPAVQEPPKPPPTQAMLDLSLLSQPLEPEKVPAPQPQVVQPPPQPVPQPQVPATTQPQGASPAFFTGIAQQQTGIQPMATGQPLNLGLGGSRQRPLAPQATQGQPGLMPPSPARPLSAPQSAQPSAFAPPPLQPQMTGIAPPGQSMNELGQQRLQQQQQQQFMGGFQPQPTGQGMMGFNAGVGMQPQPTGFGPNQFMQPAVTGAPQMQFSPMQNQPTGFQGGFAPGQQFQPAGGINSYLPPAMEPQRTGMPQMQSPMQPQPTGFGGGFAQGFNPGVSSQSTLPPPPAPLQPQPTGPAPPVRFGVQDKIAPQPTGRRANLAQASKSPFQASSPSPSLSRSIMAL